MKYLILFVLILAACSKPNDPPPVPEPTPSTYTLGLVKDPNAMYGQLHFIPKQLKALPAQYDWREHGGETPVRDQRNCGCCWAFGTTQAHEVGVKIWQQKDIDFSEQQLCGSHFSRCQGGDFDDAWVTEHGQTDEAHCGYTATSRPCPSGLPVFNKPVASGYVGSPNTRPTVDQLKNAILSYGAVPAYICGGNAKFMNYKSGLLDGPNCPVDHLIAIIGWKDVNGHTYWLVKNSWGTAYGEKGYVWVGADSFSVAERAKWIAVEKVPCPPPAVKLPKEQFWGAGDEVPLAAKKLDGVDYTWWDGDKKIGEGYFITYTVTQSTVIKLVVKNQCGDGEVHTKITIALRKNELPR